MKTKLSGNFFPPPRIWAMCVILIFTTSGCALGVYPIPFPRDDYKTDTRKDLAESLIGESQESVTEKIGQPDQILTDGKQQYMIYRHSSSANAMVMIGFIIPAGYVESHEIKTIHCFKIDLDANKLVVDYEFESTVHSKRPCTEEFWTKEELKSIEELPVTYPNQRTLKELQIPNLYQQHQTGLNLVNCISGGTRQCAERSQCDTSATELNSIPDTVNCFSCGKRQWVERSYCD